MKPYPKYKDSGIELLGEIPEHWIIIKLRRITVNHRQGYYTTESYIHNGIKLIRITDLNGDGKINYTNMPFVKISDKDENIYQVKDGDFLFPRTGSVGLFGLVKEPERSVFASYLINFRFTKKLSSDFLKYFFISDCFKNGLFSDLHGGVNQNVHAENIKNQIFAFPIKNDEQQQIASYLDHKTSKIDTLIEKKKRLIELLKEERIAVINQAVTKGLDPNVPIKNSGIEWLGEIPEHWQNNRLKFLSTIKTGDKDTVNKEDKGDYPFFVRSQTVERISSYSYDGEAVLTAGDGVGVGKVFHYYKGKFDYHQRVYKISDFNFINGKYFFYYIKENFHKEVIKISAKSTVDSLRLPMLLNFPVVYGCIKEQQQIASYLDHKTSKIDTLIEKEKRLIELLQEYRTALISEVVTGKIDVRDWKEPV